MSDTNIVVIKGRLTKSAELKYGKNNNAVVTFCIANNESRKNINGEWENIPSFFDCVVFGKYGEVMSKHLKRGRAITITGKLKQTRWESDGQKKSRTSIVVQEIELGAESAVSGKLESIPNSTESIKNPTDSLANSSPSEDNPFYTDETALY